MLNVLTVSCTLGSVSNLWLPTNSRAYQPIVCSPIHKHPGPKGQTPLSTLRHAPIFAGLSVQNPQRTQLPEIGPIPLWQDGLKNFKVPHPIEDPVEIDHSLKDWIQEPRLNAALRFQQPLHLRKSFRLFNTMMQTRIDYDPDLRIFSFICEADPNSGFKLQYGKDGLPSHVLLSPENPWSNHSNYFFAAAQVPALNALTPHALEPHASAPWVQWVQPYQGMLDQTEVFQLDPHRWVDIMHPYPKAYAGQGTDVFWTCGKGDYAIAPLSHPLYTDSLASCLGLVVRDPLKQQHYVGHLSYPDKREIEASLATFDLPRCEIYVQEGYYQNPGLLDLVLNIMQDAGALEQVQFVNNPHHEPEQQARGIASTPEGLYTFPSFRDRIKRGGAASVPVQSYG